MSMKQSRFAIFRGVGRIAALPVAFSVIGASFGAPEAEARVVSATARYERGTLTVRGKTARPRQYVSMNRGIITRSNWNGDFVFRQNRLPRSCTVRLWSEERLRTVPIRNCPRLRGRR